MGVARRAGVSPAGLYSSRRDSPSLRLGHPVTIPHAQEGQDRSQIPDNRSPSPLPQPAGSAAPHTAKIGVTRIFRMNSPFLSLWLVVSFRLSMPGLPPPSTGARTSDRVTR
jgi:hypothetical protein